LAADSFREIIFTRYVRALRDDPKASEALFTEAWEALARLLRRELARSGLSASPPRYVGVTGTEHWSPDAIHELLTDAYTFSFIDRLRALQAQLDNKPNIDGLVVLNVRNFLHERQRQNDPIGYRVFEVVRDGLLHAIDRGIAEIREGNPKVRNDTQIAILGAADTNSDTATLAEESRIEAVAKGWCQTLLPELVTGRSAKARTALRETIAGLVHNSREAGISPFLFKPLVDVMKRETRARWHAVLHPPSETVLGDQDEVELVSPASSAPDIQSDFDSLANCVLQRISQEPDPVRRERLEKLWDFLLAQSLDTRTMASRRKISELIDIPRDALPGLFEALEEEIGGCRAAKVEKAPLR